MKLAMYLIVRKNLKMSIGKTAAQVGHAVSLLHMEYEGIQAKDLQGAQTTPDTFEEFTKLVIFNKWSESLRKIVLGANEKDWEKLKLIADVIVKDAGDTEVEPGTETVLGFWPCEMGSKKEIKRLQLL